MAPSPFFLCTCRLVAAALTGSLALVALGQSLAGVGPTLALMAMPALMVMASLWLLFGIRTQPVILVAVGLSLGYAFLAVPHGVAARGPQILALLLFGLGVPLAIHGGGSLCMLRRGWADRL